MKLKNLNMYMTILKVGLIAIGVIVCLFLFQGPNTASGDQELIAKFRDGGEMALASTFTAIILFLTVGIVLLFFVVQLITNPKKTVMSILGIIVALIIYLIFYFAGTADTNESLLLRHPVSQGTIVFTTAGLWTSFVALVVAFVAVLGGFFSRFIK